MPLMSDKELESRIIEEFLKRSYIKGSVNDIMKLTFNSCSAIEQWVKYNFHITELMLNVMGTLHGGLYSWLMDSGMGMLLRSLTNDKLTPTIDLHVNYLRPLHNGEDIVIYAQADHIGKSVATLHSSIIDSKGNICAVAQANYFRADK